MDNGLAWTIAVDSILTYTPGVAADTLALVVRMLWLADDEILCRTYALVL
jgi:hypothetical protein